MIKLCFCWVNSECVIYGSTKTSAIKQIQNIKSQYFAIPKHKAKHRNNNIKPTCASGIEIKRHICKAKTHGALLRQRNRLIFCTHKSLFVLLVVVYQSPLIIYTQPSLNYIHLCPINKLTLLNAFAGYLLLICGTKVNNQQCT